MLTDFAYEAVDPTANDSNAVLEVPQSSEPSLNQPYCMGNSMRAIAQSKLNASIVIGTGTDMYDGQ